MMIKLTTNKYCDNLQDKVYMQCPWLSSMYGHTEACMDKNKVVRFDKNNRPIRLKECRDRGALTIRWEK